MPTSIQNVPDHPPTLPAENSALARRRSRLRRIAALPMQRLEGTLAEAIGQSNRQRLAWSGLLAMPLLVPVALPGMASAVGVFSLLIAAGLLYGRPLPLPAWLARRRIEGRARTLLQRMNEAAIRTMTKLGRPRLLFLSTPANRRVNALLLATAALAMVTPVPVISFDNVLLSWGLLLRDGLMLLAGYLLTLLATASVLLLWWGGAALAGDLISLTGLVP